MMVGGMLGDGLHNVPVMVSAMLGDGWRNVE